MYTPVLSGGKNTSFASFIPTAQFDVEEYHLSINRIRLLISRASFTESLYF